MHNFSGPKVSSVLSSTFYTLTSDVCVASALRQSLSDKDAHHFIVLDYGRITGVVSRGDLRRAVGKKLVHEVMHFPVLCIDASTTVEEARLIMEQQGVSFLPVVAAGAFVIGVVTEARLRGEAGPQAPLPPEVLAEIRPGN